MSAASQTDATARTAELGELYRSQPSPSDLSVQEISEQDQLGRKELIFLLRRAAESEREILYRAAFKERLEYVGDQVYLRGIIEFSNICEKNCFYCGIRRGNSHTERYLMDVEEILQTAEIAYQNDYGSLVLQSGERSDDRFIDFIEDLVHRIKTLSHGRLGITLSLGEQSYETYQRWFAAGAHRYLLRIETSNSRLYRQLHPPEHDFQLRFRCLEYLRAIGYQVGTGVMIGLPGQTFRDLADDIIFMQQQNIDMIGMGPYIPHKNTPLAHSLGDFDQIKDRQLEIALNMIAVTRLYLRDVNIAATTALQALDPLGREQGIQAGANIIMPNITDPQYRTGYQLYNDKPCLDEDSSQCNACLEKRLQAIGVSIGYNQWGDSPHYFKRKNLNPKK